jgi:hypothetical protein
VYVVGRSGQFISGDFVVFEHIAENRAIRRHPPSAVADQKGHRRELLDSRPRTDP